MSWFKLYEDLFSKDGMMRPEIVAVRERILDALIIMFGSAGSLTILVGAIQAFIADQILFVFVYLGFCALMIICAVLASRLRYKSKAIIVLTVGMGMGIMGLFRIGLSGFGIDIITAITVLAMVLFSARVGVMLLGVGVLALVAAGVTHVMGFIEVEPIHMLTSLSGIAWLNAGILFSMFTLALIMAPQLLLRRLQRTLEDQEAKTAQVQDAIDNLTREVDLRERAERAHQASETRFRELADMLPETVFETDIKGKITYVNQAGFTTFGFSPVDLAENYSATDMLHPNEHERAMRNIAALVQGESIGINEYRAVRKDGAVFPILTRSSLIQQAGKPVGMRGFIIDISDKKRLENQVQQVQRMDAIGTLAGGIAHDFNNLLMGIQGRASLMRMNASKDNDALEQLAGIDECVQSAAGLTSQLLGLARGGKYETKPTNLNELIERSIELIGRTHKDLSIRVELEPEPWTSEVDRNQIEQVLLNLLVNAWQAMPSGGQIQVESRNVTLDPAESSARNIDGREFVLISVQDDGEGILPDNLSRIFEPFFTTKTKERGTGLGLASAYGIVCNHGGTIEVESARGEGAVFRVYLPARRRSAPQASARPNAELPLGNETVLLVDDEQVVLDATGPLLERLGYTVVLASSGAEAVELVRRQSGHIDLVMLDMVMPELSGAATFHHLREIVPKLKVLLASGYSIEGEATTLLAHGCDGFIQKPFAIEPLATKLRELLDA